MIADFAKAIPVVLPRDYKYRNGKPGEEASPSVWQWKGDEVSGAKSLRNVRGDQLRGDFANWLTGNQRFAEVAALRTWISLFGWGCFGMESVLRRDKGIEGAFQTSVGEEQITVC
jgi:hypothetical protein